MYEKNVQKNVQELHRFEHECTTNVQEFYDGFVQKRSKPRDRFRGALRAATYGENARYHHIWWYLARFELTVLDGLTEFTLCAKA